ncbi:MAG: hypothetical protein WB509_06315 [Acetobacteraceae bacterium]|jgi:hypothetical protein
MRVAPGICERALFANLENHANTGAALLLSAGLCAAAEPDYADSYRPIARELGLSKNTILEIVKRNRAMSA